MTSEYNSTTFSKPAKGSAPTQRADQKTIDAVVRNLEVIGEAAKTVPDEVRKVIAVEWNRIFGLRDVLIPEYFGIDVDIIWDIVQNKVPDLSAQSVTSGEPAGFARS